MPSSRHSFRRNRVAPIEVSLPRVLASRTGHTQGGRLCATYVNCDELCGSAVAEQMDYEEHNCNDQEKVNHGRGHVENNERANPREEEKQRQA
jgi:hypothetical protein